MKGVRITYLTILGILLVILLPEIIQNARLIFGGAGIQSIVFGRWDIALVNILFFSVFIILLPYQGRAEWRSKGLYTAFIVSLFAEMYGFPLTAYFMASHLGTSTSNYTPSRHLSFTFMGEDFMLPTAMIAGGVITVAGLILVVVGWAQVYRSKQSIATGGLYKYVRHPQYTGILMVTFGWLIHWPTLPTLLMWPVLSASYYKLARREKKFLQEKYGKQFEEYRDKTPMFL
ncbi:MAG TPA: isoprenylcysteine carboxylmethyltransferase family protein [Candidatus Altiarchaeales archaeon]|nr:isoprenylcysteine carboxylmethyltransferase family protein [Candidatus Altiarchaeales archaeon]